MTDIFNGPEIIDVDEFESDDQGGLVGRRGRVIETKPKYDDDVLAEARRFLEQDEIDSDGGWREDEWRKAFWLDLPQLIEYEKADQRIKDDKDFWAWFRKFRTDEKIGSSRGKVSWWSSFGGKVVDKPKNYLKDWWSGWGWSSGGSSVGTALERKLAVALQAIQTTVSVVNMTGNRYRVEFADDENENPTSATLYDERRIVVSPQALLDPNVKEGDGIEITTGYGLHEASHVQYSEPLAKVLRDPTVIRPLRIGGLLLNILEDLRIERLTGDKFPGFAQYFDRANEYLWKIQEKRAPAGWGPEIKDKLNAVILTTKWGRQYEPTARADQALSDEFDWWTDWAKRYTATNARQLVEEGIDRLRLDPQTSKELDKMAKDEQEFEDQANREPKSMTDDEFREFLKELENALGDPSDLKACPSPTQPGSGQPIKLTPEQASQVNKLVREKLQVETGHIVFPNKTWGKEPKIYVRKPEEDADSRSSYKPPQRNIVDKMKSAFFFRKRIPAFTERLLKNGLVDDEELWRVAGGDYRVFERPVVIEDPTVQVTMLVDMSGSMWGTNLRNAQLLATVMRECLSTMKGARVRVRSHTNEGNDAYVCRIWEPGDPVTRLGLLETEYHGCNWDGFAIEWCANEMLANQRPNEEMVMIVLSDGRPNGGGGYSGHPAMDHVRLVTEHFKRKGITTIQIAIDPAVAKADQERMFEHYIPFSTPQDLPIQLTRLLVRLFGANQ